MNAKFFSTNDRFCMLFINGHIHHHHHIACTPNGREALFKFKTYNRPIDGHDVIDDHGLTMVLIFRSGQLCNSVLVVR